MPSRLQNLDAPDDLAAFTKRGQCVSDQFEKYEIEPGLHHKGRLVLGESIGNSGGANLAYRAFEKVLAQHPTGVRLPPGAAVLHRVGHGVTSARFLGVLRDPQGFADTAAGSRRGRDVASRGSCACSALGYGRRSDRPQTGRRIDGTTGDGQHRHIGHARVGTSRNGRAA